MYSNLRLLDCINEPTALIDKAIELGLSGIAITDHECLSAHMTVNQYADKIHEKYPNFKIALGNEIYLTDTRDKGQKYYHFILIAKDLLGYKALKELSSIAWYNVYVDRRMERVPTLKTELSQIIKKYKGHVIATSACIGGELSQNALAMVQAQEADNIENATLYYNKIQNFIEFCLETFGEDFYIECAPSTYQDQIKVNKKLANIAAAYNIPMVVGTDAHYLTEKERPIHTAYLNSKNGEREADYFYRFARLMDYKECKDLLAISLGEKKAEEILENTKLIQEKITNFSLSRKQIIPKVRVTQYKKTLDYFKDLDKLNIKWPTIKKLLLSDIDQERCWINDCLISMVDKNFINNETYLDRLEIEADIIDFIGNKLDDCLFAYFNTFKHYIDLFWNCGSIVGPGRGSATGFLSNYLLGITQLDPIRWGLPYWRFLNKERAELPDIDIDLAPSKRPLIFQKIREERGEFGLIQVATFGTEGTKSAILTACRGYKNEDYPEGIDVDEAQYMSSLIPSERGFLWDIKDVVYGNEEKDRKPITTFIKEVNQYPGLLDIIMNISGIVNKRSSHASGVILYGEDPYETASFMRTPSGDLITCFDLHQAETAGDTKYDFLVTEVSDKMIQCLNLLTEDKVIENLTLRELYNKYLHPEVIDTKNPVIWEHLEAGDILDVFQFNEGSGLAIAKKCKPQNIFEMMAASAMMRLMSEKGKESQQDRYARIRHQGLDVFENEMLKRGLPDNTRLAMHKYCDTYYGCVPIQEQMMEILMDKDIANFTLAEANAARKIVAKKQMNKIPQLRQQVHEHFVDQNVANYIWETAIAPSLGYAFSKNHSLPYSFVGVQTIYLATTYNPIYWDTACLIVNSGSLSSDNDIDIDDILDGEVNEIKKKKTVATDYGKIAKALGDITQAGIKISLVDINKSSLGFKPDVESNSILFGLKAMLNISDDTVKNIIEHRPYTSPKDFLLKAKPTKQVMISLIKGGAFDNLMDRKECMIWYIWETCDKKKRLTLQNMATLNKFNLLPKDTEEQQMAYRIYEFNRYLKSICKKDSITYSLDERALNFLTEIDFYNYDNNELNAKIWDKVYQTWMDVYRNWLGANQQEILTKLNDLIFMEDWNKYARGSYSTWEMETLCFYYHPHELANVNNSHYGFYNFYKLPEEPEIDYSFVKGGKKINIFKLYKICGTCIAKNKTKSIVTLLTTDGVVTVKFRKEYFSLFDKQISERQADGTKKVKEKSWFNRGNMIVVQGLRRGDDFVVKKYASSGGHQLYKINEIKENGDLVLTHERYKGDIEEDAD